MLGVVWGILSTQSGASPQKSAWVTIHHGTLLLKYAGDHPTNDVDDNAGDRGTLPVSSPPLPQMLLFKGSPFPTLYCCLVPAAYVCGPWDNLPPRQDL